MGIDLPSHIRSLSDNDIFPFKPVASSIWWNRALLEKVNIDVNIKTRHITYYMTSILKVTILYFITNFFILFIILIILNKFFKVFLSLKNKNKNYYILEICR